VAGFFLHSRAVTSEWLVTSGFYLADNPVDTGRPLRSLVSVWWGVHEVSSYPLLLAAAAGAAAILMAAIRRAACAPSLVVLSLPAAAMLPWYAFYSGHPFRYRYMVPLVAAVAVLGSALAGRLSRRFRLAGSVGLLALSLVGQKPLDLEAPMVLEAQLDRDRHRGRHAVTARLVEGYRGESILASMASLAHYMHELASEGFVLKDFLHEGNGDRWQLALTRPASRVGWILMEEQSEGGDVLAQRAHSDPDFLSGFERFAEGGGVALYRRVAADRLETLRHTGAGANQSHTATGSVERRGTGAP
jgi:hypothetical protein